VLFRSGFKTKRAPVKAGARFVWTFSSARLKFHL
jgi:hypothetical protein